MNVYAIVVHDRKDSLTYHLFNNIIAYAQKRQHVCVDILDLYARADDIPFYWSDRKKLASYPFFQENKERFMKADRLLLVFPTYWYSTPGILKCWIDLITNYAWQLEQGYYGKGLHSIQKTLSINTSLTPSWFNTYILRNPVHNQLRQTFKFMGMYHNVFYEIGDSPNLTEPKVEQHIQAILPLVKKFLS